MTVLARPFPRRCASTSSGTFRPAAGAT